MGRWVDFDKGYRTMDMSYMESIWWVFKSLWDKDLVYEGQKILPYCPRCATPLSNFEATGEGVHRTVSDPAVTVRFKMADVADTWMLAWTTTPWTLPANLGLIVGPDIEYVTVADAGARLILAADRVAEYYRDDAPEIVERCQGRDLVGRRYEPTRVPSSSLTTTSSPPSRVPVSSTAPRASVKTMRASPRTTASLPTSAPSMPNVATPRRSVTGPGASSRSATAISSLG
jgi:isoleucyl-tRNA synthetase